MTKVVLLAFVLPLLFLTIIWIESFPSAGAEVKTFGSGERIVGVEVGDWAKYDIVNASWNSTDPTAKPPLSWVNINNTEWVKSTVLAVSGTNITFELAWRFIDGTELTTVDQTDVSWGRGDSLWFISANLSTGNYIHNELGLGGFNIQIDKTTSRTYLGVKREVNHAGFGIMYKGHGGWSQTSFSIEAYWDRMTGIVCERTHKERSLWQGPVQPIPPHHNFSMSYSLTLIDTNLWGRRIFPITVAAQNFTIYATSNSSISNFEFNQTLKQVSFNIRGFTGTAGFCNVSISEGLLWGEFSLYEDGSLLVEDVDYTQTYNGTHHIFYITYTHTTHVIKIRGTEVIPEFPTGTSMLLMLIVLTAAIAIYKRRLPKKPIH